MSGAAVKIKLWIKAFLPAVLWAGVIFAFSAQQTLPGFEAGIFDFILKKIAHMFVYAVLYWLVARGVTMVSTARTPDFLRVFLPVLIVLAYALTDELHQSFVPGRYPTLRDVGYDILGASLMMLRQHQYI